MFEELKNHVKTVAEEFLEEEDKAFAEEIAEKMAYYKTMQQSGDPKQREEAEETVNDLLLSLRFRVARKKLKVRRGMRQIFPKVISGVFDIIKAAT